MSTIDLLNTEAPAAGGQAQQGIPYITQPTQQLPPHVVVTDASPTRVTLRCGKSIAFLGGVQMIIGVLSIILNVFADVYKSEIIYVVGAGYWCGLMYILVGAFAVGVARDARRVLVITLMVLSILSTVLTVGLIVATSVGLYKTNDNSRCRIWYNESTQCETSRALNGVLLLCGLIELVISITSAAISGVLICGKPTPVTGGQTAVAPTQSIPFLVGRRAKGLVGLGMVQVLIGVLAIIINIIANILYVPVVWYVGAGYWCGILFIITGSFGIADGLKKRRAFVITFMVLSIISSLFTLGLISTSAVGVALWNEYYNYYYYNSHYGNHGNTDSGTMLGVNVILLLLGLTEFMIAIVSSALCCGPLCCRSSPTNRVIYGTPYPGGQAQFVQSNGQLMQVQPGGQQQFILLSNPYSGVQQPLIVTGQPGMPYTVLPHPGMAPQPPAYQTSDTSPGQGVTNEGAGGSPPPSYDAVTK